MARKSHQEIVKGWVPFTEEECARYTAKGYWHNLTTGDLLDRNAEIFPDKLAFVDGKTEVTWKELRQYVNRMAIHFLRLGINYGDFVVLDLMNVVEVFYIIFGLNRIGAIPIMCLPRHRKAEVSYEAKHHQATGSVMPAGERFDYPGMVDQFRDEIPHTKVFLTLGGEAPDGWTAVEDLLEQDVEKDHPADYLDQFKPLPDDIFVEHLSGGTTGIPKGIPRTYNDQICQWDHQGRTLGFTDETVPLVALPVLHNAAMVELYGPAIFRGATSVICKSPRPEQMFQLVEKYRVTHILLIPIQMTYWQEAYEKAKDNDLSSLKVVMGAAEKVRPELVKWYLSEMGVQFVNIFGMAEGPLITTRWNNEADVQMHTVGRPIITDPEVIFRLVDDENKEVKRGEIGEMVSRGPLTFKGYFRAEEENKKAFDAEGFMHSGDLMSEREDGRLVVEGRKKDMIKRAGENVYPNVIEDRIAQMEGVAYCAVVGMPDKVLGEKLCAFVEPVEGKTLTFEDVIAYLKEVGVAVFELPERYQTVQGWPLTAINKINTRLLRAHITAKAVEEGAITWEHGNEYLRKDKLSIDDITEGRVVIDFTGEPS
ncbi:MAG: AMP-binding protein [Deltaproteobacteria bacterium]